MYAWVTLLLILVSEPFIINGVYSSCEDVSAGQLRDVNFAAFLAVHKPTPDGCGELSLPAVQEAEAILRTVDELNNRNYLPQIQLGVRIFDTCGRAERAAAFLRQILPHTNLSCGTQENPLFVGVIGPNRPEESDVVARILYDHQPDAPYPMITYSAGGHLSPKKQAHVYRLAIPTEQLISALTELLRVLKWNYIALVYSDDSFGEALYRSLSDNRETCVVMSLNLADNTSDSLSQVSRFLVQVSNKRIKGVVYVGENNGAQVLLQTAKNINVDDDEAELEFLLAGLINIPSMILFKTKKVVPGLIVLSPETYNLSSYDQIWATAMNESHKIFNATAISDLNIFHATHRRSISNPWFREMITTHMFCNDKNKCDSIRNTEFVNRKVFSTVSVVTVATQILANRIKDLYRRVCDTNGMCEDMRTVRLSFPRNKTLFNYTEEFKTYDLTVDSIDTVVLNNGYFIRDQTTFHVLNYQFDGDQKLYPLKVGQYRDGKLDIDTSLLQAYTFGDHERGTKFPISSCLCKKCKCGTCSERWPLSEQSLFVPGDYYLVMFAMITESEEIPYKCANITGHLGIDTALAVRYVIEQVTATNVFSGTSGLFPGVRLGLVVFNTCVDTLSTQKALFLLNEGQVNTVSGRLKIPKDKIIGFVATTSSSTASVIANAAQKMGLVYVSAGATSPVLSNRQNYPTFARVAVPDNIQVKAMIDLLLHKKWTYIQVIYQNDDYAKTALLYLEKLTPEKGICIAAKHVINSGEILHGSVLAHKLRMFVEARVVVVFAQRGVIIDITHTLQGFINVKEEREFIFLGSESWGNANTVVENTNVAVGSFTLAMKSPVNTNFYDYMGRIKPETEAKTNPWMENFWQRFFQCNLLTSFEKPYDKECNKNNSLNQETGYQQEAFAPLVIKATYAMIYGANAAIKALCKVFDGKLCIEYFNRVRTVYKHVTSATFADENTNERTNLFDDNGDGILGYDIFYIQADKAVYRKNNYVKVASWNASNRLVVVSSFGTIVSTSVTAKCSKASNCSMCPNTKNITLKTSIAVESSKWMIVALVFMVLFIILLVFLVVFVVRNRKEKAEYLELYEKPMSVLSNNKAVSTSGDQFESNMNYLQNVSIPRQISDQDVSHAHGYKTDTPQGSKMSYDHTFINKSVDCDSTTERPYNKVVYDSKNSVSCIHRDNMPTPCEILSTSQSTGCSTYKINSVEDNVFPSFETKLTAPVVSRYQEETSSGVSSILEERPLGADPISIQHDSEDCDYLTVQETASCAQEQNEYQHSESPYISPIQQPDETEPYKTVKFY